MKTAIIMALAGALFLLVGIECTSLQPADAGPTPGCGSPTAGACGCVLPILARNVGSWDTGLSQAKSSCGVPPEVARTIWDAHVQAEVLEGFVPRAIGEGGVKP